MGYFKGTGHVAVITDVQVSGKPVVSSYFPPWLRAPTLSLVLGLQTCHAPTHTWDPILAQADHVDIAEQNVDDAVWPEGIKYSRRMPVRWQASEGDSAPYTVSCTFADTEVLGWMNVHLDEKKL